jgi:hypothetical protein
MAMDPGVTFCTGMFANVLCSLQSSAPADRKGDGQCSNPEHNGAREGMPSKPIAISANVKEARQRERPRIQGFERRTVVGYKAVRLHHKSPPALDERKCLCPGRTRTESRLTSDRSDRVALDLDCDRLLQ